MSQEAENQAIADKFVRSMRAAKKLRPEEFDELMGKTVAIAVAAERKRIAAKLAERAEKYERAQWGDNAVRGKVCLELVDSLLDGTL